MLSGDANSTSAGEEGSIKQGESRSIEVDAEEGHKVTVGFSVPAPPSQGAKQSAQRSDSASDLHSLHSVSGCTVKGFSVASEGAGATTEGANSPLDAAFAVVRDAAAATWERNAGNHVAAQQAHAPHAPHALRFGARHSGALQGSLQGSLHGVAFQGFQGSGPGSPQHSPGSSHGALHTLAEGRSWSPAEEEVVFSFNGLGRHINGQVESPAAASASPSASSASTSAAVAVAVGGGAIHKRGPAVGGHAAQSPMSVMDLSVGSVGSVGASVGSVDGAGFMHPNWLTTAAHQQQRQDHQHHHQGH